MGNGVQVVKLEIGKYCIKSLEKLTKLIFSMFSQYKVILIKLKIYKLGGQFFLDHLLSINEVSGFSLGIHKYWSYWCTKFDKENITANVWKKQLDGYKQDNSVWNHWRRVVQLINSTH